MEDRDDMVEAIARAVWNDQTAGDEPRTSWEAAKTELRYSHAATLRQARIALETALPLIAARVLQEVEDDALRSLDALAARYRRSTTSPPTIGPA